MPKFPTTTIGSFPHTAEIRKARSDFRAGKLELSAYETQMRREIESAAHEQEALGLDVLVHGEAERNDMVEYFGDSSAFGSGGPQADQCFRRSRNGRFEPGLSALSWERNRWG